MSFEPPQKGNPHQFVIRQHVHTAHAIAKFYGDDQRVDVMELESGSLRRCQKRDAIFCARRVWDQRAEKGYMSHIEDEFHNQIDEVKSFENRNHEAITNYLILWNLRHYYHLNGKDNLKLNGVSGLNHTKDEQENMESKGMPYVNVDSEVPSRFNVSLSIMKYLDQRSAAFGYLKWGLFRALEGEFLVADGYDGLKLLPISPKLAFVAGCEDCDLGRRQVEWVNKISVDCAKEFYFARDFSACPGA